MICRALLVDFYGVLTTDLFAAYRKVSADSGLPSDALLNLLTVDSEGHELLVQLETGRMSQPVFESAVGRCLGINGGNLIERISHHLAPEHALLNYIQKLRLAGIRTGVLSNSLGMDPYNPYTAWELPERFDVVVLSGLVGIRKPDESIFRIAIGDLVS